MFEGLDTFATIWVNGVEMGATSNMFLEHRIDVGAVLQLAVVAVDDVDAIAAIRIINDFMLLPVRR